MDEEKLKDELDRATLDFAMRALNMAATKFSFLGFDLKVSLEPREGCKFVGKLISIETDEALKG